MKRVFLFIFILFCAFYADAQKVIKTEQGMLIVQNFLPDDYNAEAQNWSILQDKRGIYYFGNNNGLLEFDGAHWRLIPTPNKTEVRSLAMNEQGQIFVGESNDFSVLNVDSFGHLYLKSLKNKIKENIPDFYNIFDIKTYKNEVYFFSRNHIFLLKNDSVKTLSFELEGSINKALNTIFISKKDKGVFVLKNMGLYKIPYSEVLVKKYPWMKILGLSNNKLFIITYTGLYVYDFSRLNNNYELVSKSKKGNGIIKLVSKKSDLINQIYSSTMVDAILLNDSTVAVATSRNGVLIFDTKGNLKQFLNKKSGLKSNSVYSLMLDNNGLLWGGTENGIFVTDYKLPLNYFPVDNGLDASILTTYRKNDIRYVGTFRNLFYLQGIILAKQNANYQFNKLKNVYEDSWQLSEWKDFLINFSSYGLQFIKDSIGLDYKFFGDVYCAQSSKRFKNDFFIGHTEGLASVHFRLDKKNKPRIDSIVKFEKIKDPISYITADLKGNLWLSSYYRGLIYLDFIDDTLKHFRINRYTKKDGLPQNSFNFPVFYNDNLYIATQKGIFKRSGKYPKYQFKIANEFDVLNKDSLAILQLIPDKMGKIWYLSKKEAGYLYLKNGVWEKNDTIFNNISIRSIHKIYVEDSLVWVACVDGLYRFDLNKKYWFKKNSRLYIRRIVIGRDSLLYNGVFKTSENTISSTQSKKNIPYLNYKYNSVLIEYAAISGNVNQKLLYSTKLEDDEKEWSDWSKETKKRFTNIWEGSYLFKIRAKDKYGNISKVIEYRFRILPPWYRSIYALILYVLLIVLVIVVAVIIWSYRLKKINQNLEQQVKLRTLEIKNQSLQIEKQSEYLAQTNKELRKFSIVAQESDNAVIIMDINGKFEWINDGFIRQYGYNLEECEKSGKNSLTSFSKNPKIADYLNKCKEYKKSISYEFQSSTKDGKRIWAQITLTPVMNENGVIERIIAIDSDISKLKVAEIEILQQKEEILTQRDELQKLNATKDRFFSIIAHDLRGPLGTVINSTGLIVENYELFDDEDRRKMLTEIHKSSLTTYNLLENLLNWSRSQRGELKFNPENIDLNLVVLEVLELMNITALNKKISLKFNSEISYRAFADENMVSTILRNLVNNAIKFTKEGGEINILIVIEKKNKLKIAVSDNGIGILKDKQNKIFKIDEQTTSLGTNNEKGTGLGLILCYELVKKNGGKIWFESEKNKGTTFNFTLQKWIS